MTDAFHPEPWAFLVSYWLLTISLIMAFGRFAVGPGIFDRILAVDFIAVLVMCFAAVYATETGERVFLHLALAVALIVFLGTVGFARHLERLDKKERNS